MSMHLGADQRQVVANKEQYLAEARKRLSQAKIDSFLAENPDDYHRLKDVESDLGGGGPAPSPALAGLAPSMPASTPAVAGLAAAGGGAPSAQGTPLPTDLGVSGTMLTTPNRLRQGLGTRIPPQLNPVLAGLLRIY